MYGQKTSFGFAATGITVASWWMWSVTVALAIAAVCLLARVFTTLRSSKIDRRP